LGSFFLLLFHFRALLSPGSESNQEEVHLEVSLKKEGKTVSWTRVTMIEHLIFAECCDIILADPHNQLKRKVKPCNNKKMLLPHFAE
jgi:hypothetical protein